MVGKKNLPNCLRVFIISIFLFLTPQILLSEGNKQHYNCLDQAFNRIEEIQSLPLKKYLYTLDGQNVLLKEFYYKCLSLFPQCCIFTKFYYWQSEIREVVSNTKDGMKKHKIRVTLIVFLLSVQNGAIPQKPMVTWLNFMIKEEILWV